jgi:ribosomal protein L37AE/L43A
VDSVDWLSIDEEPGPSGYHRQLKSRRHKIRDRKVSEDVSSQEQPIQLPSGKWACNHRCKDKTTSGSWYPVTHITTLLTRNRCKHFCCRDGLDKPPKFNKKQTVPTSGLDHTKAQKLSQLTLVESLIKDIPTPKNAPGNRPKMWTETIELLDLTQPQTAGPSKKIRKPLSRKGQSNLDLCEFVASPTTTAYEAGIEESLWERKASSVPQASITDLLSSPKRGFSSDFSDIIVDDLPSPSAMLPSPDRSGNGSVPNNNDNDFFMLEDSLVNIGDLWDSVELDHSNSKHQDCLDAEAASKQGNRKPCDSEGSVEALDNAVCAKIDREATSKLLQKSSYNAMLPGSSGSMEPRGCKRPALMFNDARQSRGFSTKRPKQEAIYVVNEHAESAPVEASKNIRSSADGDSLLPSLASRGVIDSGLLDEFKDLVNFL